MDTLGCVNIEKWVPGMKVFPNNFSFAPRCLLICGLVMLSGCASVDTIQGTKQLIEQEQNRAAQRAQIYQDGLIQAQQRRQAAQEVNIPFIAGNAVPLAREVNLPDILKANLPISALFSSQPVPFEEALRQLSAATGLVITATPDALQDASSFAPRSKVEKSPVQPPLRAMIQARNTPIWKVLDDVAAQTRTWWRPTPTGAEFYRLVTRQYDLSFVPQTASTKATVGRNTAAQNAFAADTQTSFVMDGLSQAEAVKAATETMLSGAGRATFVRETQTLVVVDTPEVHELVDAYVKRLNSIFNRKIRMVVEALEITNKRQMDLGVDWNLVYSTLSEALNVATPSSTITSAGGFGIQSTLGKFTDSSLVVKMLSESGYSVNRTVFPVVTMSGRPVTRALRSTFNYVDQVQTSTVASSSNQAVQAPTITQKDETVGTLLTLVPIAQPDGRILLSAYFDVTSAEPLRPFTVGEGAASVTVQQKTINGSSSIQEVTLRAGRTELIGGVDIVTRSAVDRGLTEEAPLFLGGSVARGNTKSITVLLVTAVIEDQV